MESWRGRGESLGVGENVTNCCVARDKKDQQEAEGIYRDKEAHKITCFIAKKDAPYVAALVLFMCSRLPALLKSRSQPKKIPKEFFTRTFYCFMFFRLLLSLLSHFGRQHSTNVYQWKERRRRTSVLCIENSQSVFFRDGRREVARIINK